MKNLFKISTALVATAAICMFPSCTKDTTPGTGSSIDTSVITFTEGINKMATRATDTAFESADVISVTAYDSTGAIFASDVEYTYNNGLFSSEDPIIYGEGDAASLSFRALYPAMELPTSNVVDFTILADQSTDSNYTLSDFMSGYAATTSTPSPQLTFNHMLTKVVFNITSLDVEMVNVTTSVMSATEIEYNISTLSYEVAGESTAITMANNGTNSYKAIILPQAYTAGSVLGIINVDGTDYELVVDVDVEFYAGVQYTYALTLFSGRLTFDEPLIENWIGGDDDGNDDSGSSNDDDNTGSTGSSSGDNIYGHVFKTDIYMDGRSSTSGWGGSDQSFIDFETGTVYTACTVMANTDLIDMVFYDSTAEQSVFRGPQQTSGVLKNWQCNSTSLTVLYPAWDSQNINSSTVCLRALDPSTSSHAALISAYENDKDNLLLAVSNSLISAISTPSAGAPIIYQTVASYDGKGFDLATYNYGLIYSETTGLYGIIKITDIKFYSTDGINSITFDYAWGCVDDGVDTSGATTTTGTEGENSYGHMVQTGVFMDGRDHYYGANSQSFIDFDSGLVYSSCNVLEGTNAESIDMLFYDSSETTATLRGPSQSSGVLKNWQCNGTSLTSLYSAYDSVNINSSEICFRALDPSDSSHAALIAAYEAGTENLLMTSANSLVSAVSTPSASAPVIYQTVSSYDGKGFDLATYNYGLIYSKTTGTYGMLKITDLTFYQTDYISSMTFDYIWGI